MFEWEEGDRFSFEDSERFEEDSLCSWISEPESLCNNWRGWKRSEKIASLLYGRARDQGKAGGRQVTVSGGLCVMLCPTAVFQCMSRCGKLLYEG